jgi:hypothetical protein
MRCTADWVSPTSAAIERVDRVLDRLGVALGVDRERRRAAEVATVQRDHALQHARTRAHSAPSPCERATS